MISLQVKFSALVVTLLVAACVGLAFIATHHERTALEDEVEKRGRALAASLAGAAKEPLLAVDRGEFDRELLLERLNLGLELDFEDVEVLGVLNALPL